MKIHTSIRRIAASALLAAGLTYPACAAVCPRGIGGCPAPGRCFLYVDADANTLCDYTARTGSQSAGFPARTGSSGQAQSSVQPAVQQTQASTTVQATATPVPADPASAASIPRVTPQEAEPANTTAAATADPGTVTGNTATEGLLDTLHISVPVAEILLFLVMTGIFFLLFRKGIAGIREVRPRPALALSALFGLGTSLMLTSLLTGSAVAGTTLALVYMAGGTPLVAYLWYRGTMTRRIVLATALVSVFAGFVFVAPIMPMELGGIVNVLSGLSAMTAGTIVICLVILSALAAGRVFCGALCPVGLLQECAYAVPARKVTLRRTEIPELVRAAVFAVTAIAALYLVDLMAYTGLYDLFSLTFSAGFIVAAALVLLSLVFYRPVCRVLCPFGVLFSLPSAVSIFRIRRTGTCTDCGKCEKACPARVAGRDDPKRECYLCGRCIDVCPVKTGVVYRR
ncbi:MULTISPECIES: 4Fe-4S binding protein [unclassified Methanoregula]|uniref:4Fe-4S binding protein n=1 Tax=unclassified Methanoregula TaxID=2649730 RepID=UPI0009D38EF9|nr:MULTISPECIES: 4Fe-4S binding protein [unclassified Methanoregula]OPX62511.1 MAG: quinol dehydrogenase membrane component [Methanoregula sp. PtaB.Bin085]OPY31610.1 MAG: quinol dehydrogenase membrane component [Methanoregula sp. PtaU1.Bin006]